MKVTLFFRKPEPQFNSVEELFSIISKKMSSSVALEYKYMPYGRITLKKIYKNLKYSRANSGSINHITGHINYVSLGLKGKTVLTIHDIGSSLKGSLLNKCLIILFWYWLPALFVKKITVISMFSKVELLRFIPFAEQKIKVIHNPVNKKIKFTPKDFNSTKPIILLLGTKSNKNLENTIKALKEIPCELHIIGKLTLQQEMLLKQSKLEYRNQFNISYQKIIEAYMLCDVVCFASFYEGFGMPIIEGQATGRPVVTSNLGAMKEISGGAACLVDPYSVTSIRKGLELVIGDDEYRFKLIQNGYKNTMRFKLDKIVNEYLTIYQEINKTISEKYS